MLDAVFYLRSYQANWELVPAYLKVIVYMAEN